MDYVDLADIVRQPDWHAFLQSVKDRRLVLATTSAGQTYADFRFRRDDILLFGRESSGVPDTVRDQVPCHIKVPMQPGARSLNVAIAAAMMTGEGDAPDGVAASLERLAPILRLLRMRVPAWHNRTVFEMPTQSERGDMTATSILSGWNASMTDRFGNDTILFNHRLRETGMFTEQALVRAD
jgi:hypothetical protein